MDWTKMSAAGMGREIEAGRLDPVELAEGFLAAIQANAHGADIYARLTHDRARAEADAARGRARSGLRRSQLDGVPISWKDLYDTAGVATESGSRLLEGRVPDRDAEVLRRATEAGLVCLGKTHQTELAFSGLGLNPMTATPPCVNDLNAVPGGSSSGAAASVAFGLAAAGIGSDTGGSVRVPAAWNDLVGLKTSVGTLSISGVLPLAARFDTVGPLTRTVEDAALLLDAMGGGAAPDLQGASLAGRRFLSLTSVAQDDLRTGPAEGYARAIRVLSAAGADIVDGPVPEVAEAMGLAGALYTAEAYGTWGEAIEAAPDKMFGPVRERFRAGRDVSGPDFVRGWQRLDALRSGFRAAVAGFDAVLVPTAPISPPNRAALEADHDFFVSENLLALRNTRIGNLMDCSCVTLPTGVASVGITLMCGPGEEQRVLRLAAAAEAALGGGG